MLRLKCPRVRRGEDLRDLAPVRGEAGDADTHRDRERGAARLESKTGNLLPERLEPLHGLADIRVGEDDDEFITPEASGQINVVGDLAAAVYVARGEPVEAPRAASG
jgi:hypothetical protein